MTVTLYSGTVPPMLQMLEAVAGLLRKAREFCAETGMPEDELAALRLAPDMWPFSWQVRGCITYSCMAVEALGTGLCAADFGEMPGDFDTLERMVADGIAVLRGISPDVVDAAADKPVLYTISTLRMPFTGADFIQSFALPSFHFHAAMIYALLRGQGVVIGKRDFLGKVAWQRGQKVPEQD